MATEIGQAYVQIMPSAKGIGGMFQNQINPEAEAAGKSGGFKLGTALKVAAIAGVAATGVALGKVISSSLSEGADLQQSLGGVETLFKDNADKVKKYAAEGYKTAGLSANAYMETVTGFSASMIKSLNGDTKKAADLSNQAIVDMSDNANKMGTNIGDIQNAYQGFAKQNYTMLDNLKLGYGGTKEEMQRLLTDAQKLTGQKYDISNFADITEAIHAIQTEMDITGTTSKEAATTFSGSFDSMKAALSNVLGNMSLGRDIQPSLNALITTTSTFLFNNFIPMVGNIFKALPGALSTLVGAAGKTIADKLGISISPGLLNFISTIQKNFSTISTTIEGTFNKLKPSLQGFMNGLAPLGTALVGVFNRIPPLLNTVISGISPVLDTIGGAFQQLPSLFTTVVNAIGPVISKITTAFSQLDFSGVQALISEILPALQTGFTTVMAIVGPALDSLINSFVKMWNAIQPLATVLAGALMPVFQVLGSFIGGVLKGAMMALSGTFDTIRIAVGFLTPLITILVNVFKSFVPALSTVAQWIGVAIGLFAGFGAAGNSLKTILTSAWTNIKNVISTVVNGIKGIISGVVSVFKGLGNAGSVLKSTLSSAWNGIRAAISTVANTIRGTINGIKSIFSSLNSSGNALRSAMSGVWNGIKGAVSGAASGISRIIGGIKNTFNSLKNIDLSAAGRAIIDGFIGGLKSTWEAGKRFVGRIADWIKKHKGPISYDKKLLIPAGQAIMGGFNNSLMSNFQTVKDNVSGMASELSQSMKNSTSDLHQNLAVSPEMMQPNSNLGKPTNSKDSGKIEVNLTIEHVEVNSDKDIDEISYMLADRAARNLRGALGG